MTTAAEDHQLVARTVASGDTDAFGELIRRHQSRVRTFLRRLTRDPALADDLAQDCFLHAWDKLRSYTGRGSFVGWLLRIAWTTFLQSKRRSTRYAEVLSEAGHEADALGRTHTSAAEDVGDLDRLLAILSEEERAVIVMSYACGMSHREIAEAVGQPVGTVKSLIFRGKQKVRTHFELEDHQYG